jgi:hypothetical protein
MENVNKKELAKWRNSNKWLLSGMCKHIKLEYLTDEEKTLLNTIYSIHKALMEEWDDNSIKLGLTVRPKCWCGKIGKYIAKYEMLHKDKLVCKKHIEQ